MVLALAEAVAIPTGDAFDHGQARLHYAHVVAGLVRPDLLAYGAQLVRAVVTIVLQLDMAIEKLLHHAFGVGMNVRFHEIGHTGYHAPSRTEANVRQHD